MPLPLDVELAAALRDDILLLGGATFCQDADPQREKLKPVCPCFATLHPFCSLYHSWICVRIDDDGTGACCTLPEHVVPAVPTAPGGCLGGVFPDLPPNWGSSTASSHEEAEEDDERDDGASGGEAEDDPLSHELRGVAARATRVVRTLEDHVDDMHSQRAALLELLPEIMRLDGRGEVSSALALEEIIGWCASAKWA